MLACRRAGVLACKKAQQLDAAGLQLRGVHHSHLGLDRLLTLLDSKSNLSSPSPSFAAPYQE